MPFIEPFKLGLYFEGKARVIEGFVSVEFHAQIFVCGKWIRRAKPGGRHGEQLGCYCSTAGKKR